VPIIAARYNGPPTSANGGYACGVAASALGPGPGVVEVTLRLPPPLDRELSVGPRDGGIALLDGESVVAEAGRVDAVLPTADPVPFEAAVSAATRYPWAHEHPWATCFVCGTQRVPDDGLRIFPGAVTGTQLAASPWIPDDSLLAADGLVETPVLWAALDCPSWFGFACFESWQGRPLLGRMAAEVLRRPQAGEPCVAVGLRTGREGRKVFAASAVYTADGELLGRSRATWILVP
jgi:hypothetical protein